MFNKRYCLIKKSTRIAKKSRARGFILTDTAPEARDGKHYAYLIAFIMLIGFLSAFGYNCIQQFYFGYTYPYNTFLFLPAERFRDFFIILFLNKELNPYLDPRYQSAMYPFLNFISYLLALIPKKMAFAIYLASTIIPLWMVLYQRLRSIGMHRLENLLLTLIISICSYPMIFTLDRGNFEGMLFSLVLLFWIFFEKKSYWISAVLLSMSIAFKGFPLVFIIFFFSRNKLKYLFGTLVLASAFTIIPLFTFQGGFIENAQYILSGNNFNNWIFDEFLSNSLGIQRGPSVFTLLKITFIKFGLIGFLDMAKVLKLYFIFAISIFIFISIYVLSKEQALWKKASFLTFSIILLPHLSGDYKLIYIFIPLIFFLSERHSDPQFASFFGIMFALLLIPKQYIFLNNILTDSGFRDVGIGVWLNPIMMIMFLIAIVMSNLKDRGRLSGKDYRKDKTISPVRI